jgi:hypothetical protein
VVVNMTHSPIEAQVETLCKIITKKSSEFWEERNKAMIDLTVAPICFEIYNSDFVTRT